MNSAQNSTYIIHPDLKEKLFLINHRFRPAVVQQLIRKILKEKLQFVAYNSETCSSITKELADDIKSQLKSLDLLRYKFIVNVQMGEVKGEAVKYLLKLTQNW